MYRSILLCTDIDVLAARRMIDFTQYYVHDCMVRVAMVQRRKCTFSVRNPSLEEFAMKILLL